MGLFLKTVCSGEKFLRSRPWSELVVGSAGAQEQAHPEGFDYENGSPHLKHSELRALVETNLRDLVTQLRESKGVCRVLEVGAGHGGFTQVLLDAGATVTVTEMSGPSAQRLANRFLGDDRVDIVHDPSATWVEETDETFDLVACISVLHHIPDYLAFLRSVTRLTSEGGAFVSWQDPTWYSRRTWRTHRAEQVSYSLWRVFQGDLRRGLATRVRRLRGVLDESLPEDMSEYHVVRDGVDEQALAEVAAESFGVVGLRYYWSTQSRLGQRIGARWDLPNTFMLEATHRRALPEF